MQQVFILKKKRKEKKKKSEIIMSPEAQRFGDAEMNVLYSSFVLWSCWRHGRDRRMFRGNNRSNNNENYSHRWYLHELMTALQTANSVHSDMSCFYRIDGYHVM
ncbi:hypothetical protein B566_EDAN008796 [Ephemera danica]|nr:hypothetical protein B566_EDAN008796 [Ephemera danica]